MIRIFVVFDVTFRGFSRFGVASNGKDIPGFPFRFLGLARKGFLAFRYPWVQWKERVI